MRKYNWETKALFIVILAALLWSFISPMVDEMFERKSDGMVKILKNYKITPVPMPSTRDTPVIYKDIEIRMMPWSSQEDKLISNGGK